jgi:hypothetical protein
MTVLATFSAGAMQQGDWPLEREAASGRREDYLAELIHAPHTDRAISFFVPELFHGADLNAQVLISAEEGSCPLSELLLRKGCIFTVQALVAENLLRLSVDDVILCILEHHEDFWGSADCWETAARLIVLASWRAGDDPAIILDTIERQAQQNPQQHRHLVAFLPDIRRILERQGF